MTKFMLVILIFFIGVPVSAARLALRGENNFYSQYAIQYSSDDQVFLGQTVAYKVAYSSSRIQANSSRILPKDDYRASLSWILSKSLPFRPYLQTDVGYTSYEINDNKFSFLENSAWTWAILIGAYFPLMGGPYGFEVEIGYSLLLSSTVDPITASLGFSYDF